MIIFHWKCWNLGDSLLAGIFFWVMITGNVYSYEESDIIDVTSGKYGRIQLSLKIDRGKSFNRKDLDETEALFKKYLMWSGFFDLVEGKGETDLTLMVYLKDPKSIEAIVVNAQTEPVYQSEVVIENQAIQEASLRLIEEILFFLTREKSFFKSRILYVEKNHDGRYRIVLTDCFGGKRKTVLDDGGVNILPRWRPDGKAFVYTNLTSKGSRLIEWDMVDSKSRIWAQGEGTLSGGTWSGDAQRMIVTLSKRGNSDLYWMNREGRLMERVTYRSSIESNPSLSPDGKRVLFVSNRSGSAQIYQKNLEEDTTFRMTFTGNYNVDPKWSPNGDRIVFSGIIEKHYQVFVMDKDGIWAQQLTDEEYSSEQPNWSPDGKQIIYTVSDNYEQKLYIMRQDGSYKRRLTNQPDGVNEFNPSWIGGSDETWNY
ncbi:MAG: hypothetical protein OEY59_13870 [Deltaproteobacteria bacterium]|nr:hypothetical protein [Deltaproteobacteria bacterium]